MVNDYGFKVSDVAVNGCYPRFLHKLMFSFDMPSLWSSRWFQMVSRCFKWEPEARLVFVQPVSLYFDTFFTAPFHEMIPFIWDCWPCYYDMMEKWLTKHKVKTAIFTSSQEMAEMQKRCPDVKMVWCYEGINGSLYHGDKLLKDRQVDVFEFGRGLSTLIKLDFSDRINHVCSFKDGKFLFSDCELRETLSNSKIVISLTRNYTNYNESGDMETLTQRYWECMLSGILMVGHCPQELIDLIGYNPLIELNDISYEGISCDSEVDTEDIIVNGAKIIVDTQSIKTQIINLLDRIETYQPLVDKNKATASRISDWKYRMSYLRMWLIECGYLI